MAQCMPCFAKFSMSLSKILSIRFFQTNNFLSSHLIPCCMYSLGEAALSLHYFDKSGISVSRFGIL